MLCFPNAKINLGLHVTNRRSDGFHDIETVFLPVGWQDALEAIKADKDAFSVTGRRLGRAQDNLCVRAYRLMQLQYNLPSVAMHLHKMIPSGAGLGGGSSDATLTLQLLNNLFDLGLSRKVLSKHATTLGSDCPFFLWNRPAIATGRGEMLRPLNLDLSGYHVVICYPGIAVSTASAYKRITPHKREKPLKEVIHQPVKSWKAQLANDFEAVVFPDHGKLPRLKATLYELGADYAAMSGSGSAIFGLFPETPKQQKLLQSTGLAKENIHISPLKKEVLP